MDHTPSAPTTAIPRPLFVYALLYGGMTVLAGVLGFKQIALPLGFTTLAVESGIFAFLMLVAISSAIAQVYGRAVANKLVLWGFAPLGLSILLIWVVLSLPPSPNMSAENLAAFETVLGQVDRIMIAGPIAYGVSLLLNVWLFERLRGSGEGSGFWMMLRGGFASAISQTVDTLISVVPGGASTSKAVDMKVLKALGPNGVFVNIGRGSTVDEEALIAALSDGTILAAGLDVFADEPRVPKALINLPNATLLPHVGSASVHTRNAMADLVADNLESWFTKGQAITAVPETAAVRPKGQ